MRTGPKGSHSCKSSVSLPFASWYHVISAEVEATETSGLNDLAPPCSPRKSRVQCALVKSDHEKAVSLLEPASSPLPLA